MSAQPPGCSARPTRASVAPRPHTHPPTMASLALRRVFPASPVLARYCARLQARRAVSRDCSGPRAPAAPACVPAPRPACRPRPAATLPRAVRVVCCPPPQGARPPCPARVPAPPLTCADRTGMTRASPCVPAARCEERDTPRCGAGQDRVARRLAAAAAARRRDYEREAAGRKPPPPAPGAPYTLGEDRICTRATDGREYALPCAPPPAPPCRPGRVPPAPRCVPLRPDDACRASDGRLDPCAHRPRIFLEIDRSGLQAGAAPARPTSRGRRCSLGSEQLRRQLHSSAAHRAGCCARGPAGAGAPAAGGLDAVLRARAALQEAGRGRVAPQCAVASSRPPAPLPGGRLELAVPAGVQRVLVSVSLSAPASAAHVPWLSMRRPPTSPGSCRGASLPPSPCGPTAPRQPPCGPRSAPPPQSQPCAPPAPAPCGPARPPSPAPCRPAHPPSPAPCGPARSPSPAPCGSPPPPQPASPCADKKPSRPKNDKKCTSNVELLSDSILF